MPKPQYEKSSFSSGADISFASPSSELLREACSPCCLHDKAKECREVKSIQLMTRLEYLMEEEQTHLAAFSSKEGSLKFLLRRSGPTRHCAKKARGHAQILCQEGINPYVDERCGGRRMQLLLVEKTE